MSLRESPLSGLKQFLPEGSFDAVVHYLIQHKVHLHIVKERQSILGNYRNAHSGKNHRITINGNLNIYEFLVVLLHELAHLLTYDKHGHRVAPHGEEWKTEFSLLLSKIVSLNVFPAEIERAIKTSLHNPAASACADVRLMRVLRKYDAKQDGWVMIEELETGTTFKLKNGKIFIKGERIRKRFRCMEIKTGLHYLFSPISIVKLLTKD